MKQNRVKKLIQVPVIIVSALKDVNKQKRYINNYLRPFLDEFQTSYHGLHEDDLKKITSYYGFGVPSVLGELFCTLRGEIMTGIERKTSTWQGGLTGLFDDFFDKQEVSQEIIQELVYHSQYINPEDVNQALFQKFAKVVLENTPHEEFLYQAITNVYKAQQDSLLQKDSNLDWERIKSITFNKGGYSIHFYRAIYKHPFAEGESAALYNLGALMQLANDIFDVYKDSQNKTYTLPTSCKNISQVREIFDDQMQVTLDSLWKMDYPEKNKHRAINKFMLGIARTWVALDQLQELESNTNGKFLLKEYTRKALICDMEKPRNLFRAVKYYLNN